MNAVRKALPIILVGAAIAVGVMTYAFTATNTVPNTKAGSGSGTVSGYTITNVDYTLGADPDDIDQVEFDLDSAPAATSEVLIKLNTQQYTCTFAASHATCDTTAPQATVGPTTSLSVIAVD